MGKYPFELTIYWKDGNVQVKFFESLATCMKAAESLKPSICTAWSIKVELISKRLAK